MKSFVFFLTVFICLSGTVYSIFPTPKYQQLSSTEFLQVSNVCLIRHVLSSKQQESQQVLRMFENAGTEANYYLNKILKRKNNNLHCHMNKIFVQDSAKMIDLVVLINKQQINDKEGYKIQVSSSSPHIILSVNSYSGYVYALQTLSQMIDTSRVALGTITDSPLVSYRGIMIDSSRHFLQISTISRLIQSMPLSKLNILHWHLSDDESVAIQLSTHPQLAEDSAFKKGQYYTVEQVKQVIALGKKNGVDIVPELDTPAHVRAWGLSKKWKEQNITILCPRGQGYNHQFDVSKTVVYQLAQQVYKEIDSIFKDSPYLHLGGDQVFGACWDLRPSIKTFMALKNIKNYGELQTYWRHEMKQALPQSRQVIFWRNDAQNLTTSANDIIHFWGAQADIAKVLGNSTSKVILSPSDYLYINKGIGNIWFNASAGSYSTWKQIYQNFNIFPSGIAKQRVLGAQVTLWGEVSNDDTLENNIWMRATAFGAKLWADQTGSIKQLVKDLVQVQKNLEKMGVRTSAFASQFCEQNTDKCLFAA